MGAIKLSSFSLFFFALASLIPDFTANNIGLADANSIQSQKSEVLLARKQLIEARNGSEIRRELKGAKKNGPCVATNIIDKCWRCDPHWADNRQGLADCAMGFGRNARGGKGGKGYVVTDPSDDNIVNPRFGTLRYAVIQPDPLWITFQRPMYITLTQELIMASNKTIDGRGASVTIRNGAGITIQNVENIIIHNIHIRNIIPTAGGMIRDSTTHMGFRTADDGDGVSLFGAKDVWLDHLSMSKCADGLIDAIEGSTGITISNCHFTDHDKAMLFGARDNNPKDKAMQVTLAFNHFGKRMMQRMPRCRSGFFHIVNNDYTHWDMYAIGGSSGATIISQGNRFVAKTNLKVGEEYKTEITHRDGSIPMSQWNQWTWVSDGDIYANGAHFTQSGDLNGAKRYAALELIKAEPGDRVKDLTKDAGYITCKPNKPC